MSTLRRLSIDTKTARFYRKAKYRTPLVVDWNRFAIKTGYKKKKMKYKLMLSYNKHMAGEEP